MSRIEAALILFIILYIIMFLGDYIFFKRSYLRKLKVKDKKGKKKKIKDPTEIIYLVNKFNLDKDKLPMSKLLVASSLINSFIISLVAITIMLIDTYLIFQLLIGFVLLLMLIYAIYELVGRYLVKKGYEKNGK